MNKNLAKTLVEKGVLTANSEIDANYKGNYLGNGNVVVSDTFTIYQTTIKNNQAYFLANRNRDGNRIVLKSDNIYAIDGMDPERVAKSYNLDKDGNPIKQGKKRGRKTKAELGLI